MLHVLKLGLRILLPVLVLGGGIYAADRIIRSKAPARRRKPPRRAVQVEVVPLRRQRHRVVLDSRGSVRAPTQSRLAVEVAGRVVEVAEALHDGGYFQANQPLVRLDDRDHRLEIKRLEAQLAQATASLGELAALVGSNASQIELQQQMVELQATSLARAKNLSRSGVSAQTALEEAQRIELAARTKLVELRSQAQVLASRREGLAAAVRLTEAQLERARLDQQRTRLLAPFAGRALQRSVEVGEYVNRGQTVATVYAVDKVEVRLPLTDAQLAFVDLPVRYAAEGKAARRGPEPVVRLMASFGGREYVWPGRIVRTEGAIDSTSRQLYVVAQVKDPYAPTSDGRPPLRVGTYVRAQIDGRELDDVVVVERAYVHGEDQLLLVDAGGTRLSRRTVKVLWRDARQVVIADALPAGSQLCTTPVVFAGDSIAVQLRGVGKGKGKGKRR